MRWLLALALFGFTACAQTLDLPLAMVPSPDGKFLLVLDSGKTPGISVRETADPGKEVSRLALGDAWLGLTFAKDKKTIYASGGARGVVYEIAYSEDGALAIKREMRASDFVGDVELSPDGRLIYAADVFANLIAVINPQSGRVIDKFKTGRRPYRIVFHPDGKSYFVSSWADAAVYQYNTENGEELGRIRLGPHTTDMVLSGYQPMPDEGEEKPAWKYRLFVAVANTNSVYSVGITENKTMRLLETIDIAPERDSPLGMTPSALALSPDQRTLFVACADAGVVARVDVSDVRGIVDSAWEGGPAYPLAILGSDDGSGIEAAQKTLARVPTPGATNRLRVSGIDGGPLPSHTIERVVYIITQTSPVEVMRAIAGIAPDYTVKLSHQVKFDLADPANTPPTGYLWTNALAAGMTVQIYGVLMKGGKSIDPAVRDFSDPDVKNFLSDLKEGEASGDMPRLVIMQATDPALQESVVEAVKKSRFGATAEIETNLARVEYMLHLKPMTREDGAPR